MVITYLKNGVTASVLWAISDSAVKAMNRAVHGELFENNQDAAFATLTLFESIGYIIAFGYADAFCNKTKLWIVFSSLIAGYAGLAVCIKRTQTIKT